LCGIESIEEAMRAVAPVTASLTLDAGDVATAVREMTRAQVLNMRTRAVHAAGFYRPGSGFVAIREDVGRHNALDKLAGALAVEGMDMAAGAIVMSSRLSIELVQKAAAAGCGILIAVSAPTTLAVETAERAGITLAAVVRDAEFELFTHPHRITGGDLKHVA
jgi:FdhD protein